MIGLVNKMKNKAFIVLIGISIISLLCSCAGMEVKPDRQEAATLIFNTYDKYPKVEKYEMKLAKRLFGIIKSKDSRIHVILPDEFRKEVFNGICFKDTPRSHRDLILFIHDEESCKELEEAKVRFIISLEVKDVSTKGQMHADTDGECMFIVGRHWKSKITLNAYVLDIKNPEKPGIFYEEEDGVSFCGVLFIYVFPIPYGWYPIFKNCMAFDRLATRIVEFMGERMGLEPVVPVVIEEHDFDNF